MPISLFLHLSSQKILPDLILISFLLISSLKLLSGIEAITDIRLSDESYYLHNGLVISQAGFPAAEWAPLYSLWYWLLNHVLIRINPIDLYYLNHKLLIALIVIGLYGALRAIGCNLLLSSLAGVIVMLSGIPVIWPRPTHFAILFLLAFIATIPLYKKPFDFLLALGVTLLLVSFIRPEYFLAFLVISSLIGVGILIRLIRESVIRSLILKTVLYGAIAALLILLLGVPTSSGGRGWWAFASHFALRWTWWTGSSLNPWTDYAAIVSSVFGDVDTIRDALAANPDAFGRFIWENLLGYITGTVDILTGSLKDDSPLIRDLSSHFHGLVRGLESLTVLLVIAGIVWRRKGLLNSPKQRQIWLYLLGLVGSIEITLIPASILIFPRYHYLLTQAILVIVLLAFAASRLMKSSGMRVSISSAIGIGLVILLLIPSVNYGWCLSENLCFSARMPANLPPNLATLRYLQSLQINQSVNLLAAGFEYRTYLETPINRIDPFAKAHPFGQFLSAHSIDMMITDPWMLNDPAFQADAEWQDFLKDPTDYGFTAYSIPQSDRVLLVKNLLLSAPLNP